MKFWPAALLLILLASTTTYGGGTPFSLDSATAMIRTLAVDIGPRPMGSPAEQRALQFATASLKRFGCDTAYVLPMTRSSRANTTSGVGIGIKKGKSGRIIVIGGHIDSAGPEIPGADDDGSGSAVVLETARILAREEHSSTLVFCLFGGEEQGLEGSRFFVRNFERLDSIAMMLQIDMANGLGILDIDPTSHDGNAPPWLVRAAVEEYHNLGYAHLQYPVHFFGINYALPGGGAGSDHESFLDAGIPAIDFSTDVGKPIHTPRDNFENFDPRGLKRSGDLVLKLVERFDGGTPGRSVEQYMLYLFAGTPLFFPYTIITGFIVLAAGTSIVALIRLRRRRVITDPATRVRWSGLKLLLATIVTVTCGWFSSNVVGLVRGIRFPWFTSIDAFTVLSAAGALTGLVLALRMLRRFRLSQCPYLLYLRAFLLLMSIVLLTAMVNLPLAVAPAIALLLTGAAMIVRQPWLKLPLLLASPWWMLRWIFSEWDELLFRSLALGVPQTPANQIFLNGAVILIIMAIMLPFIFAGAAAIRDSTAIRRLVGYLLKPATPGIAGASFGLLAVYAMTLPVYSELWHREVRIDESFDLQSRRRAVALLSKEYLTDTRLRHGALDTLLQGRIYTASFDPSPRFDTSWATVDQSVSRTPADSGMRINARISVAMCMRPYTVTVRFRSQGAELRGLTSPLYVVEQKNEQVIHWYSFPDQSLQIPFSLELQGKDTVRASVEIVFADLADTLEARRESTYFIPRTTYTASFLYAQ